MLRRRPPPAQPAASPRTTGAMASMARLRKGAVISPAADAHLRRQGDAFGSLMSAAATNLVGPLRSFAECPKAQTRRRLHALAVGLWRRASRARRIPCRSTAAPRNPPATRNYWGRRHRERSSAADRTAYRRRPGRPARHRGARHRDVTESASGNGPSFFTYRGTEEIRLGQRPSRAVEDRDFFRDPVYQRPKMPTPRCRRIDSIRGRPGIDGAVQPSRKFDTKPGCLESWPWRQFENGTSGRF